MTHFERDDISLTIFKERELAKAVRPVRARGHPPAALELACPLPLQLSDAVLNLLGHVDRGRTPFLEISLRSQRKCVCESRGGTFGNSKGDGPDGRLR